MKQILLRSFSFFLIVSSFIACEKDKSRIPAQARELFPEISERYDDLRININNISSVFTKTYSVFPDKVLELYAPLIREKGYQTGNYEHLLKNLSLEEFLEILRSAKKTTGLVPNSLNDFAEDIGPYQRIKKSLQENDEDRTNDALDGNINHKNVIKFTLINFLRAQRLLIDLALEDLVVPTNKFFYNAYLQSLFEYMAHFSHFKKLFIDLYYEAIDKGPTSEAISNLSFEELSFLNPLTTIDFHEYMLEYATYSAKHLDIDLDFNSENGTYTIHGDLIPELSHEMNYYLQNQVLHTRKVNLKNQIIEVSHGAVAENLLENAVLILRYQNLSSGLTDWLRSIKYTLTYNFNLNLWGLNRMLHPNEKIDISVPEKINSKASIEQMLSFKNPKTGKIGNKLSSTRIYQDIVSQDIYNHLKKSLFYQLSDDEESLEFNPEIKKIITENTLVTTAKNPQTVLKEILEESVSLDTQAGVILQNKIKNKFETKYLESLSVYQRASIEPWYKGNLFYALYKGDPAFDEKKKTEVERIYKDINSNIDKRLLQDINLLAKTLLQGDVQVSGKELSAESTQKIAQNIVKLATSLQLEDTVWSTLRFLVSQEEKKYISCIVKIQNNLITEEEKGTWSELAKLVEDQFSIITDQCSGIVEDFHAPIQDSSGESFFKTKADLLFTIKNQIEDVAIEKFSLIEKMPLSNHIVLSEAAAPIVKAIENVITAHIRFAGKTQDIIACGRNECTADEDIDNVTALNDPSPSVVTRERYNRDLRTQKFWSAMESTEALKAAFGINWYRYRYGALSLIKNYKKQSITPYSSQYNTKDVFRSEQVGQGVTKIVPMSSSPYDYIFKAHSNYFMKSSIERERFNGRDRIYCSTYNPDKKLTEDCECNPSSSTRKLNNPNTLASTADDRIWEYNIDLARSIRAYNFQPSTPNDLQGYLKHSHFARSRNYSNMYRSLNELSLTLNNNQKISNAHKELARAGIHPEVDTLNPIYSFYLNNQEGKNANTASYIQMEYEHFFTQLTKNFEEIKKYHEKNNFHEIKAKIRDSQSIELSKYNSYLNKLPEIGAQFDNYSQVPVEIKREHLFDALLKTIYTGKPVIPTTNTKVPPTYISYIEKVKNGERKLDWNSGVSIIEGEARNSYNDLVSSLKLYRYQKLTAMTGGPGTSLTEANYFNDLGFKHVTFLKEFDKSIPNFGIAFKAFITILTKDLKYINLNPSYLIQLKKRVSESYDPIKKEYKFNKNKIDPGTLYWTRVSSPYFQKGLFLSTLWQLKTFSRYRLDQLETQEPFAKYRQKFSVPSIVNRTATSEISKLNSSTNGLPYNISYQRLIEEKIIPTMGSMPATLENEDGKVQMRSMVYSNTFPLIRNRNLWKSSVEVFVEDLIKYNKEIKKYFVNEFMVNEKVAISKNSEGKRITQNGLIQFTKGISHFFDLNDTKVNQEIFSKFQKFFYFYILQGQKNYLVGNIEKNQRITFEAIASSGPKCWVGACWIFGNSSEKLYDMSTTLRSMMLSDPFLSKKQQKHITDVDDDFLYTSHPVKWTGEVFEKTIKFVFAFLMLSAFLLFAGGYTALILPMFSIVFGWNLLGFAIDFMFLFSSFNRLHYHSTQVPVALEMNYGLSTKLINNGRESLFKYKVEEGKISQDTIDADTLANKVSELRELQFQNLFELEEYKKSDLSELRNTPMAASFELTRTADKKNMETYLSARKWIFFDVLIAANYVIKLASYPYRLAQRLGVGVHKIYKKLNWATFYRPFARIPSEYLIEGSIITGPFKKLLSALKFNPKGEKAINKFLKPAKEFYSDVLYNIKMQFPAYQDFKTGAEIFLESVTIFNLRLTKAFKKSNFFKSKNLIEEMEIVKRIRDGVQHYLERIILKQLKLTEKEFFEQLMKFGGDYYSPTIFANGKKLLPHGEGPAAIARKNFDFPHRIQTNWAESYEAFKGVFNNPTFWKNPSFKNFKTLLNNEKAYNLMFEIVTFNNQALRDYAFLIENFIKRTDIILSGNGKISDLFSVAYKEMAKLKGISETVPEGLHANAASEMLSDASIYEATFGELFMSFGGRFQEGGKFFETFLEAIGPTGTMILNDFARSIRIAKAEVATFGGFFHNMKVNQETAKARLLGKETTKEFDQLMSTQYYYNLIKDNPMTKVLEDQKNIDKFLTLVKPTKDLPVHWKNVKHNYFIGTPMTDTARGLNDLFKASGL